MFNLSILAAYSLFRGFEHCSHKAALNRPGSTLEICVWIRQTFPIVIIKKKRDEIRSSQKCLFRKGGSQSGRMWKNVFLSWGLVLFQVRTAGHDSRCNVKLYSVLCNKSTYLSCSTICKKKKKVILRRILGFCQKVLWRWHLNNSMVKKNPMLVRILISVYFRYLVYWSLN